MADERTGQGAGPTADRTPVPESAGRQRRRMGQILLAGLAAVAILALGISTVNLTGERDRLRDDVDELEVKLALARGDAGAEISALETELDDLEVRATTAEGELATASADLETTRDQLEQTTDELDTATTELADQRVEVARLTAELAAIGEIVVPMPELLGLTREDAEAFVAEFGGVLLVDEVVPTNVIGRPGTIIDQQPAVDAILLPGSVVWIQLFAVEE